MKKIDKGLVRVIKNWWGKWVGRKIPVALITAKDLEILACIIQDYLKENGWVKKIKE